jgi:hypothetical protein
MFSSQTPASFLEVLGNILTNKETLTQKRLDEEANSQKKYSKYYYFLVIKYFIE